MFGNTIPNPSSKAAHDGSPECGGFRRAWCASLVLLVLGLAAGCTTSLTGRAATDARKTNVPPSGTLWAGVRGGVSLPITATLTSPSNALLLETNKAPYPVFGASMMFRTSQFDVGAQFDSIYGGTFKGLNRDRHFGARSRLVAAVRWRGFEAEWGALYSGLGVGIMFFNHHDDLLATAEESTGLDKGPVRATSDRFNSGFTFNVGAGLMFYPTQDLIIFVEGEMAGTGTSITTEAAEADFGALRVQVNLGVELRVF